MTILDLIKAVFLPKHMKRLKDMSALFAICLFILSMYAIIFPTKNYYNRKTHDLVVENDLYYLHSLMNMPTSGEALDKFVSEIKENEGISIDGLMQVPGLALKQIQADDKILGIITKGEKNWYFNNADTNIVITTDTTPVIKPTDNGIIIENVNDKVVSLPNVSKTDNLSVLKVTVNNKGALVVNDTTYDNVTITSKNPMFSINNNKLTVDNIETNVSIATDQKVILYFIPNESLKHYETSYTYKGEDGVNNHIKFIIDLEAVNINECTYKYDEIKHPNINDDAYFFITVTNSFICFQAHPSGIEELNIERNGVKLSPAMILTYYANSSLDFKDINSNTFGTFMTSKFEEGYKVLVVQSFSLTAFIFCIVYPLIITLLFSLLFKRNGKLKSFKEYYNIAALSNLVPALLSFVIMWFNPMLFTSIYLFLFAIYYLFVLYKINNSPDLV